MADEPWTIDRICTALGNPTLATRFLGQINRAPAHEMLAVFAKWQGIAERTLATAGRIQQAQAAETAGFEVPGEWLDATDRVLADAARIRAQGAA